MDTVYGTKKYFQSLSGVSDIYRAQTCRQMVSNPQSFITCGYKRLNGIKLISIQ